MSMSNQLYRIIRDMTEAKSAVSVPAGRGEKQRRS